MAEPSQPSGGSGKRYRKRSGISPGRRRWFRILAVMFPLLLLAGAEGLARLKGYGGYPPFLTHVGSDGQRDWYSTFRPGVDSFFYTRRSHTGGMRTIAFTTPKPPGTFRVVLLGGSAMQGYPQDLALTTGALLQAMLSDVLPETNRVEVLNLGATAMASFPAMCFLEEMLKHEPDVVVVMSGNNEFFGAYGVCSLHSSGTSPVGMRFMRWARGLGLVQWANDKFEALPDTEELKGKPLMQLVVGRQQIGPDDRLRGAAVRTLQSNLTRMTRLCRKADVPLILCTLPTNERGLAPVGDDIPPPLSTTDLNIFTNLLADAESLLLEANPAEGSGKLQEAIELYPKHARSHYLLGQARTALGDDTGALQSYIAARDLDTMPWRATSTANDAVRAAANEAALLCDMEAAFRSNSPGGSIGWELMDDHVHMSVEGQALFARTLLHFMTNLTGPGAIDPVRVSQLPNDASYVENRGRSIFTDYVVASRMKSIFGIPFMTNSNPTAAALWNQRAEALLAEMDSEDRRALEHWKDPGLHVTSHRPLPGVVGYYRMLEEDWAGAAPLFRVARACVANVSLFKLQFTWWLIHCEREANGTLDESGMELCREAIEVGTLLERFVGFRDPLAPSYLGMAYHAVGDYASSIHYLDNAVRYAKGKEGVPVVYALADSLVREGQPERAELLLNLARRDPAMKPRAEELLREFGMSIRDIPTTAPPGS